MFSKAICKTDEGALAAAAIAVPETLTSKCVYTGDDMAQSNRAHTRLLLPCAVAAAVIAGAALLFVPGAKCWFNDPESFKAALQFLFVAVLGGAAALSFRAAEALRTEERRIEERERDERRREEDRDRERRGVRRAALEAFHGRLVESHHAVKRVRRALRAASFAHEESGTRMAERARLEASMAEIEEAQLRTEALAAEVRARGELFGAHREALHSSLSDVEKYLRSLLQGFEDGYAERRGLSDTDLMPLGGEVEAFVARLRDRPNVREQYFERARESQRRLLAMIEEATPATIGGPQPASGIQ